MIYVVGVHIKPGHTAEQYADAWVVSESRIHGRYKDNEIDLISIETAVLARAEDGWKIVHLH